MSTVYRVLVTCDEMSSAWCAGMLELSGPTSRVTSEAAFFPLEQGWVRGYNVDQGTYDVCPACQTPVTRGVLELGSAGEDEHGVGEDDEQHQPEREQQQPAPAAHD